MRLWQSLVPLVHLEGSRYDAMGRCPREKFRQGIECFINPSAQSELGGIASLANRAEFNHRGGCNSCLACAVIWALICVRCLLEIKPFPQVRSSSAPKITWSTARREMSRSNNTVSSFLFSEPRQAPSLKVLGHRA